MKEKIISLEEIDPLLLWGANNSNYQHLISFFPELKFHTRGNILSVTGTIEAINQFEKRISPLFEICKKNQILNTDIISNVLNSNDTNKGIINPDILLYDNAGKAVRAFTPNQKKLAKEIINNDLIFAYGPAGSGKTYTSIALAVKALKNREVKRIILSRPAVEAGENLGYLPGDIKEKLDPYLQPLYDALQNMIPSKKLKEYFEDRVIEIAPLAFMRGRTLDNAFVILDEAQNATKMQLKMFLTRMGKNAKFIITGDITQIDLPRKNDSGLIQSMNILANIEGISIIEFDECDIIRHRLVKFIVKAYENN